MGAGGVTITGLGVGVTTTGSPVAAAVLPASTAASRVSSVRFSSSLSELSLACYRIDLLNLRGQLGNMAFQRIHPGQHISAGCGGRSSGHRGAACCGLDLREKATIAARKHDPLQRRNLCLQLAHPHFEIWVNRLGKGRRGQCQGQNYHQGFVSEKLLHLYHSMPGWVALPIAAGAEPAMNRAGLINLANRALSSGLAALSAG